MSEDDHREAEIRCRVTRILESRKTGGLPYASVVDLEWVLARLDAARAETARLGGEWRLMRESTDGYREERDAALAETAALRAELAAAQAGSERLVMENKCLAVEVEVLQQMIENLGARLTEAVELVADVVAQECQQEDGSLTSRALRSHAEALRFLAAQGRVEITAEWGQSVRARWRREDE